uniref:Candidate secreted effector n=1 Tax=Meloidogyne incognita TaxID=6306 RepID=A0A914LLB5_MELIC
MSSLSSTSIFSSINFAPSSIKFFCLSLSSNLCSSSSCSFINSSSLSSVNSICSLTSS